MWDLLTSIRVTGRKRQGETERRTPSFRCAVKDPSAFVKPCVWCSADRVEGLEGNKGTDRTQARALVTLPFVVPVSTAWCGPDGPRMHVSSLPITDPT